VSDKTAFKKSELNPIKLLLTALI